MTLHRFCCPDAAPEGGRVRIEGAVAAQIRKVLRLGPGERIVLFGVDEWEYLVQLESVERDVALGAIVARAAPRAEPQCSLTLAVALLKGEKSEWVLQKGTELGVGRFVLMQTRWLKNRSWRPLPGFPTRHLTNFCAASSSNRGQVVSIICFHKFREPPLSVLRSDLDSSSIRPVMW